MRASFPKSPQTTPPSCAGYHPTVFAVAPPESYVIVYGEDVENVCPAKAKVKKRLGLDKQTEANYKAVVLM